MIKYTAEALEQIEETEKSAESLSAKNDSVNQVIEHISKDSKIMFTVIDGTTSSSFLQTVKLDHVTGKSEVYRVVCGRSEKGIEGFADQNQYRLSKWYYESDGIKYRGLQKFNPLPSPHSVVHRGRVAAITAYREENHEKV